MLNGYRELVGEVDRFVVRLVGRYGRHLACRRGCSDCCRHHLSIFPVEAASVREALQALPDDLRSLLARRARKTVAMERSGRTPECPLLVDGTCCIYEARPIICRTQGLPLLITAEDGVAEVDFCPLNFSSPGAMDDLDEKYLLPLEVLNSRLALVNISWCRQAGLAADSALERTRMADLLLEERA